MVATAAANGRFRYRALFYQICDLVQARTGQAGTTTRLHMRLRRL
jgi:hypothetical protein